MHRKQTSDGSSCSHGTWEVKPSSSFLTQPVGFIVGLGEQRVLLEQEWGCSCCSGQLFPGIPAHLTSQSPPKAEPLLEQVLPVQGQDPWSTTLVSLLPRWIVADQQQQQHSFVLGLCPLCLALLSFAQVSFAQVFAKGPCHPAEVGSPLQGITLQPYFIWVWSCKAVFNIFEMQLGFCLISYEFCAKTCLQCCNCCFQNAFQLFPLYPLHLLTTFPMICSLPFWHNTSLTFPLFQKQSLLKLITCRFAQVFIKSLTWRRNWRLGTYRTLSPYTGISGWPHLSTAIHL